MPFYLQMSKNITQQRDIYDTVIFRFLQIFYGLYIYISMFSRICKVLVINNSQNMNSPTGPM